MRNNGFAVGFNMPEALKGEDAHSLPPYVKIMPYLVDKYPACPQDWLRSEGIVKSFFVPVREDRGMWLDLNENDNHTHHVAIVVSIQGVNPITGMPCKDAQLEQYIEECPKHKIKFGPDRYCSKCDYKWPKQNYICTTGTQRGRLWLDGFRTAEGVVRQYILTAEKMRGVASNIIGKDKVYAIGLSFFVSKEKKPRVEGFNSLRSMSTSTSWNYSSSTLKSSPMAFNYLCCEAKDSFMDQNQYKLMSDDPIMSAGAACCSALDEPIKYASPQKGMAKGKGMAEKGILRSKSVQPRSIQVQKLEVGAGAKINQDVGNDPEKLDFWHDKPESIICINYAAELDVCNILKQGEIDLDGHVDGFLKNLPLGN